MSGGFLCRICGAESPKERYEYNDIGELEYWSCDVCKCDRIGIFYLERAGFNGIMTHQKLYGRPGYKGINMDTVQHVVDVLRLANRGYNDDGDNHA